MHEKHYYLRSERENGLHRCGIVYLIKTDKGISRGISLCNEKEDPFLRDEGFIFDKEENTYVKFIGGLKKAKKRALKALNSGKSSEEIRLPQAALKVSGLFASYKSEFNPNLNEFEMDLISK